MNPLYIGIILTVLVTGLFLLIPIRLMENKRHRTLRKERREENRMASRRRREAAEQGYDHNGRNSQGEYNRYYDIKAFQSARHSAEGFLNPQKYPVGMTDHARKRIIERLGIQHYDEMYRMVFEAYQFGKSALQVAEDVASKILERQKQYKSGIVLLHSDYLYVFSPDNVLITIYKNEDIVV